MDRHGGTYYVSDEPLPVYGDRNGGSSGRRTSRYSPWNGFDHDGELKGHRRLAGGLGDPHEHGVTETFIRLVSDPRDVCTPVPSPAPAP